MQQTTTGFDWGRRKTKKETGQDEKAGQCRKQEERKVQTTTTKNRGEKNKIDQTKKWNQIIALIGMQGSLAWSTNKLRLGSSVSI